MCSEKPARVVRAGPGSPGDDDRRSLQPPVPRWILVFVVRVPCGNLAVYLEEVELLGCSMGPPLPFPLGVAILHGSREGVGSRCPAPAMTWRRGALFCLPSKSAVSRFHSKLQRRENLGKVEAIFSGVVAALKDMAPEFGRGTLLWILPTCGPTLHGPGQGL